MGPAIRSDLRATGPIPPVVQLWMVAMLVMLVALALASARSTSTPANAARMAW